MTAPDCMVCGTQSSAGHVDKGAAFLAGYVCAEAMRGVDQAKRDQLEAAFCEEHRMGLAMMRAGFNAMLPGLKAVST